MQVDVGEFIVEQLICWEELQ